MEMEAAMRFWIFAVGLVTLSSCNVGSDLAELKSRVSMLEVSRDAQGQSIQGLSNRLASLETNSNDFVLYLSPAREEFGTLKTEVGVLAVSIQNVQPYANGSKVEINFGNPTLAEISQSSAKLEWGRSDDRGLPDVETSRSRDIEFAKTMLPGSWNPTEVILEGVPPAELGFVGISHFQSKQIKLRSF